MRHLVTICVFLLPTSSTSLHGQTNQAPPGDVAVELSEGIPDKRSWDFEIPNPGERYTEPAFGLVAVPTKYSSKGLVLDRSNPYLLRATGTMTISAGQHRLLLRTRGAARLFVDDKQILQTAFLNPNASGHEKVPDLPSAKEKSLPPLAIGHQEKMATVELQGGKHTVRLEVIVGGKNLKANLGEVVVGLSRPGKPFQLLSPGKPIPLSEEGWTAYTSARLAWHFQNDRVARRTATVEEVKYWNRRHALAQKVLQSKPAPGLPDVSSKMPVHNAIDRFIGQRLDLKKVEPASLTDDLTFLRRVTLDTAGVIPTRQEIIAFLKDNSPEKRQRVIDRLLADDRWADHWVSYWQDVLAENPGILKPTLNNTGPFRWWLHQAFLDNLPMDRFVTELLLMEGSKFGGAPGGFAMATENDVPMAAKAHVLARAFLGVELGCARCHDAPYHPYLQNDLFSLAAMLNKNPQMVPATSSVKVAERARRPLIEVTLEPGTRVKPAWPFRDLAPAEIPADVLRNPPDTREQLAAILTSPHNERFAQVIVNRLWKRYLGWGLVEPVDDWYNAVPSHPELLQFLARELVMHNHDLKHVARLILNSHTYQRVIRTDGSKQADAEERLFASPARRRLSAEQLVDSLFLTAGKEFHCEELTMDPEGRRPVSSMLTLGKPRRAWEFTSLSNERDRPALALPVAQSIVDLLMSYGWRDARPNPLTVREETPTPLQPLLLANGIVGSRITTLSDDSTFTELCLQEKPMPELIDSIFLQILSRRPTAEERQMFANLLGEGFEERRVPGWKDVPRYKRPRMTSAVSWSNHLSPEATKIKLELERLAREGDPPTTRLRSEWRERMEDMIWSLVNSPEFVFVP